MRPDRLLAAACRDTDAHDVSHPLLLWRAREKSRQDARGDSGTDKGIKEPKNIRLTSDK